ncbi:TPA: PQQ-dependent sugar dehydrogenase [Candidatus Saccharibacteria bacterium]|nr:PQQ-dependent sugar dehydrogenase [Candidatus Saccharibacteria bacterium]HIO87623.1 PQQ-dependent sugar dehydrogenase [Candidatus Saccharibacteria bacterium]
MRKLIAYIFVAATVVAGVASFTYLVNENVVEAPEPNLATKENISVLANGTLPEFSRITLVDNLTKPWDVAVSAAGEVFFTEKGGTISRLVNGKRKVIAAPLDARVEGEAGMMGLALDSDFETNRFLYACFASNSDSQPDVRVVRWQVAQDANSLIDRTDIITGIPYNLSTFPGRHSGCRVRVDTGGVVWVGTGDAAIGTTPQNPRSLGGKVLRVDRDGSGIEGNIGGEFDERIFSFGHRNVQGLALGGDGFGYSAEHGSDVDDELNMLATGNFGWDPVPGYTESGTPMTDLDSYPNAIEAVWLSGDPTIAVSGAEFIEGEQWGLLNGAVLLAVQKDQHVRALLFNDDARSVAQEFEVLDDIGRVRSVVQAPNQDIYITTDNGGGSDQIIRLSIK